jgi:hypothetical protein
MKFMKECGYFTLSYLAHFSFNIRNHFPKEADSILPQHATVVVMTLKLYFGHDFQIQNTYNRKLN